MEFHSVRRGLLPSPATTSSALAIADPARGQIFRISERFREK